MYSQTYGLLDEIYHCLYNTSVVGSSDNFLTKQLSGGKAYNTYQDMSIARSNVQVQKSRVMKNRDHSPGYLLGML